MTVRMDLAELDLDEIDERVDRNRIEQEEAITELVLKVTTLTRSNLALMVAIMVALLGIIGTLLATR